MNLYKHQIEAIQFFTDEKSVGSSGNVGSTGNVGLFLDCGLGKTAVALKCFEYIKSKDLSKKLLVICPLTLIQNAWVPDIEKFTNFTYHSLRISSKNKSKFKDADIYLMNYEMILSKKNYEFVKDTFQDAMCVLDESAKIKNFKSQTTKRLLSLRFLFSHKLVMSGCAAPNGFHEYWAQMVFLNDDIFPTNYYKFRGTYFHLARGKQILPPQGAFISKTQAREIFSKGFKYEITEENKTHLLKLMQPHVMFKRTEDCIDLPESTDVYRRVDMQPEQARIYHEMRQHLVTEIRGSVIAANMILSKLNKLRQIVGGSIINEGQPIKVEGAKLKELAEIIEELGDKQAIIWGWFTAEIAAIQEMLGEKAVIVNGTVSEETKNINLALFKEGRRQFLIANPQSIAHGVTLTNAHYSIYYSLSYSHEQFYQSKARIRRISQENKCFYIYLICNNTIDELMLGVLERKESAENVAFSFMKDASSDIKKGK